ncbi:hypothetical protein A3SI_06514 [Nitritalea halalkaliphila LW7]|uniref:Uncharacterized protein n=1 Tax=Nitritalea halalkaliphila LW7 TaxID=1189621 RepID=I5C6Y4_9BACT|nr:hypothetical protein A3SI_06514 [Nitritalea halalkaliphila LW7]
MALSSKKRCLDSWYSFRLGIFSYFRFLSILLSFSFFFRILAFVLFLLLSFTLSFAFYFFRFDGRKKSAFPSHGARRHEFL